MDRRAFLASAGALAGSAGLAGCFGGGSPGGTADSDGYPPEFPSPPPPKEFGPEQFSALDVGGVEVPLASIEVVYNWYLRRETRVADARGPRLYERSRILGAALSTAFPPFDEHPNPERDPVTDWPKEDRIVCYCGCPHHLSSLRAAALIADGYRNVYVLDEGFREWYQRGYPMAGENVEAVPDPWIIDGVADPRNAGEYAWAVHESTRQYEAVPIDAEGRYELDVWFVDVDAETPISVHTPGYVVTAPLGKLVDGIVHG